METEHDNLQAVTAVGAFEEARLQEVRGHRRGQIDPPVCQTVTVKRRQRKATSFYRILYKGHQNYMDGLHINPQDKSEPSLKITSDSSRYCLTCRSYRGVTLIGISPTKKA